MSTHTDVIEAAKEVHGELGEGFTEAVYHSALQVELSKRGIEHSIETTIPIMYKGHSVGRRRPDLMVTEGDSTLIVELKAGNAGGDQQLLQYLDMLGDDSNFDISGGMLVRFNDTVEIVEKDA